MGKGYRTQLRQLTVSSVKPTRFITETQAPVGSTLGTGGRLSWQWFNCLYLSLKKGFPRLGLPPLGSFDKWQGENLKALCHYLKEKPTTGNKQNRHFVLNWWTLKQNCVWRQIYAQKLPQRCTCNYKHLHSRNTPRLFVLSVHNVLWVLIYSCWRLASTQVKLQWNIIIWRHLLTLTVH